MSEAIERLILALAAEARPVRRLAPPLRRAVRWLAVVAVLSGAAILLFANLAVFAERARDPRMIVELAGTLLTGIAATIAAFYLSLPDRSPAWALLPLPPLAFWLASSGLGCYRHWVAFGPDGWVIGESADCFRFILLASVPLGASLLLLLRRAYPLWPVRVAALGGLGVAGIAAFVLQFFHPFDVTLMDLGIHLLAVAIVVLASSALASWSRLRAL